eukprot:scaffold108560_cov72-Phaeocystis_antarctica.AAC.3
MVLRARRGVGGDVPGPWQGRLPARIAQPRRVGEFYPKLRVRFLGVGWPRPEFRFEGPQICFINMPDLGPNF